MQPSLLPPAASRTQQTYDAIADLARRLGPEAQLPTFSQLREQLSVSVITLNKALSQLEVHQVLYRRHGVGIFVSPQLDQQNIAVVCSPRFFEGAEVSPFWKILLQQARDHVEAQHHAFSLHFSAPDGAPEPFEEAFRRSVQDQRVHGILGVGLTPTAVDWIVERGIPLVVFAGYAPQRIEFDYTQIVFQGVRSLAGKGCRRIALWLNHNPADTWQHSGTLPASPLLLPYQKALTAQGLTFDPALVKDSRVLQIGSEGPPPVAIWEQGYRMALSVFGPGGQKDLLPDGIVSPSELFTQGIIVGLQQMGIGIGDHIHLASHANESSPVLQPWASQMTLMEVSPSQLAKTMLEMLEVQMTDHGSEKARAESVVSLAPKVRAPRQDP